MTSQALDILLREMFTNPSLIEAVTVLPTCTHRTNTPEHLTVCCADGVDCDVCGQPIEGLTGPMLLAEGDFDAAVCADCGFDRLYQLEA